MIIKHPQDELRIRKLVENDPAKSILWQTKNFQVTPSAVKDNGCFIYSEPKTETIKIAKLATIYDFPELSGTNSFSENLTDTPDKKTNVLSDSLFKSPAPKRLKFTSTPNKNSPRKQLCSGNVNEIDNQCLEEIEQDLSRDFCNMSMERIKEDNIEDTSDLSYLSSLIPDVLTNLAANNQKDIFVVVRE